jgi:hypothetical protein
MRIKHSQPVDHTPSPSIGQEEVTESGWGQISEEWKKRQAEEALLDCCGICSFFVLHTLLCNPWECSGATRIL